jgi:hypothetical protein
MTWLSIDPLMAPLKIQSNVIPVCRAWERIDDSDSVEERRA